MSLVERTIQDLAVQLACAVFVAFLVGVVLLSLVNAGSLFAPRHGRRHRACGLAYLSILAVGVHDLCVRTLLAPDKSGGSGDDDVGGSNDGGGGTAPLNYLAFDALLGVTGLLLTLSAAYDFKVPTALGKKVFDRYGFPAAAADCELAKACFKPCLSAWLRPNHCIA